MKEEHVIQIDYHPHTPSSEELHDQVSDFGECQGSFQVAKGNDCLGVSVNGMRYLDTASNSTISLIEVSEFSCCRDFWWRDQDCES